MYDNWKEQEKGKITSASSEKTLKTGMNLFGQGASALGAAGITDLFMGPMQAGRAKAGSEVQFWIDKTFSPITNELRYLGGRIESIWGEFFYENRAGGFIGKNLGMGFGALAGFYLPGGPLLWSALFGIGGEVIGLFTQAAASDPEAPPGGYNFGPVFGADPFSAYITEQDMPSPEDEPIDIIYDRTGPTIMAQNLTLRVASRIARKIGEMSWI